MRFALLALTAILLLGQSSYGAPAPTAKPTATAAGAWTLRARQDAFTGETSCRLVQGRATWERGVVVFHLGGKVNTAGAIYRIDDGAPVSAAADEPAVAALGLTIWRDDLANPSAGVVRIPAAKLANAHLVRIEPRARATRFYSFPVDGLAAAVDAAKAKGCR
jgi:hypothetical protein